MGGKSFSRLISRQGCFSHSGDALSVHSIIIPLLTKEGLGEVVALVDTVKGIPLGFGELEGLNAT